MSDSEILIVSVAIVYDTNTEIAHLHAPQYPEADAAITLWPGWEEPADLLHEIAKTRIIEAMVTLGIACDMRESSFSVNHIIT